MSIVHERAENGFPEVEDPDVEPVPLAAHPGGSLRDRVQQRDRELQEEKPIELPVPGFEEVLVVRYRALGFKESRRIGERHERTMRRAKGHQSDVEMLIAADTLLAACETILERQPDGTLVDTEYRWGVDFARDVFGRDLPENSTERQALLATFRQDRVLMTHFGEYAEEASEVRRALDKEVSGESAASSATA